MISIAERIRPQLVEPFLQFADKPPHFRLLFRGKPIAVAPQNFGNARIDFGLSRRRSIARRPTDRTAWFRIAVRAPNRAWRFGATAGVLPPPPAADASVGATAAVAAASAAARAKSRRVNFFASFSSSLRIN